MNVLEEMSIETGRAEVRENLDNAPALIRTRLKLARQGAMGTAAAFFMAVATGHPPLLIAAPILGNSALIDALVSDTFLHTHAADVDNAPAFAGQGMKILTNMQKVFALRYMLADARGDKKRARKNYWLASLVTMPEFVAAAALFLGVVFFFAMLFRMPAVADLIDYGFGGWTLYFCISRMRHNTHLLAALETKHADFSDN